MTIRDIDSRGNIMWYKDLGKLHREDGPAYIRVDGSKAWFLNGKRHRLDGPALIYADGSEEWWVNGNEVTHKVLSWIGIMTINQNWKEWTDIEHMMFRLSI